MGSQIQGNSSVGRTSRSSHASRSPASVQVGSIAATLATTSGHLPSQNLYPSDPADYDPMLAPLPPPFETFDVPDGGVASINEISWDGRISRPIQAGGTSTSRHVRPITRSTLGRPLPPYGPRPRRQTHHTGDSAEEPICIE
jgi:hypothetical protein